MSTIVAGVFQGSAAVAQLLLKQGASLAREMLSWSHRQLGAVQEKMSEAFVKPMEREAALSILGYTDDPSAKQLPDIRERYAKLRELNVMSPYLQCKLDEAVRVLGK